MDYYMRLIAEELRAIGPDPGELGGLQFTPLSGHACYYMYFPSALAILPQLSTADPAPHFPCLGEGIQVQPAGGRSAFRHRVIVSSIYADYPARQQLARAMGSAAGHLGCYFCCLKGVTVGRATRFLGYLPGTAWCCLGLKSLVPGCRPNLSLVQCQLGTGDDQHIFTHEEQESRASELLLLVLPSCHFCSM